MDLTMVSWGGVAIVEAPAGSRVLSSVDDTVRLLETCYACGCRALLVRSENLARRLAPGAGDADAVIQKLLDYGVRLAIVGDDRSGRPSDEPASARMVRRDIGIFATREDALAWLAEGAHEAGAGAGDAPRPNS